MVRLCLNCDKEIIGSITRPTQHQSVYEVELNVLCNYCKMYEKIKDEKKELNKKLREMNRKQKYLEEVINRTRKNRSGATQAEREWLDYLRSMDF